TLFVITTRRVIVNANLVTYITVEFGVQLRLEDVLQHRQLRLLFGLEGAGIVQNLAVAVAENVGREPAVQPDHAGLETGRKNGLEQRLSGLVVLAANRRFHLAREVLHGRDVHSEVRRAVGERHTFLQRGVRVDHRGRDVL